MGEEHCASCDELIGRDRPGGDAGSYCQECYKAAFGEAPDWATRQRLKTDNARLRALNAELVAMLKAVLAAGEAMLDKIAALVDKAKAEGS